MYWYCKSVNKKYPVTEPCVTPGGAMPAGCSSPRGESGRQLLARLAPRPQLRSVLTELCPHQPEPGDVVEISGPCESGGGRV